MDPVTLKLEQGQNTGVIIDVRPTDFVAGAETGVAYDPRNATGDWEPWKPTNERQSKPGVYDSNSCVTYSGLNILETQLNWMLDTGLLPAEVIAQCRELGYIDENNRFNFNDWFAANTNGTTGKGNTLQAFWDGVRTVGLIGQKDGYKPDDFATMDDWFDKSRVTDAMRTKAKKFLDIFKVEYEWVVLAEQGAWEKFLYHVKHAPLHIATPTCGSWNSPEGTIVTQCGDYKTLNHATAYIGQPRELDTILYHKDLDHYSPFVKRLAADYYIPYALKGIVSVKAVTPAPAPVPEKVSLLTEDTVFGMPASSAVRALQLALQSINSHATGKPYMKPGVFGPYGPATRTAVDLVQREHGIEDPERGANAGPQTRAVINAILKSIIK